MTVDQRLTRAAREVVDGLVPPLVDVDAIRARARRHTRRTALAFGRGRRRSSSPWVPAPSSPGVTRRRRTGGAGSDARTETCARDWLTCPRARR